MSRLVPLREVATLRFSPPTDQRWIEGLSWIPVSPTELHLACRYFPLAVRVDDGQAKLGLLIDKTYIVHSLLTADGKWRGAYRPIALRCFPFQASKPGDDPLSDILVPIDSEFLSASAGHPALVDGKLNSWVVELHRLLNLLKRGEEAYAGAIDQLLIADLLTPLANMADTASTAASDFCVVSARRFAELNNGTLGAMARHNFQSLDVTVAGLFSLQNLKPEYRPKGADRPRASSADAATAFDTIAINDLPLALDDGELVPLADLVPAPAV